MSSFFLFDVRIDGDSRSHVLRIVRGAFDGTSLGGGIFCHIVTLNPEILLLARHNESYRHVLNNAVVRTVDGVGISFVGRLFFNVRIERLTGVELFEDLLFFCCQKQKRIAIFLRFGGLSSVADVEHAFLERFPHISLLCVEVDPCCESSCVEAVSRCESFGAEAIFVSFGAPEQEFFLSKYFCDKKTPVRVGVGIGGAVDYLTKRVRRAPLWMQSVGLEWFWRLFCQPKRIARIFHAVVVFPFFVCVERFKSFFVR